MQQPPIFREERADVLHALIRAHPLALLASAVGGLPCVDHVPMVLADPKRGDAPQLQGHLAAVNPLAQGDADIPVVAVFQGPQAYISPSHYASKVAHGKVVPTWNYVTVHAHGTLRRVRDTDWLMGHLADLTDHQEQSRAAPWAVSDAPADFMARQLRGIVGLTLTIDRLEGVWKVSQNKDAADRAGILRGLDSEAPHMAAQIRAAR